MAILIVILIIFLFMAITIPRQMTIILKSMEAQARSVSSSIALVCANAIVIEDFSFIVEHSLNVVKNNPDILYVIVTRKDGFSLIHTEGRWEQRNALKTEPIDTLTGSPVAKSNLAGSPAGSIQFSPIAKKEVFHYSFPLKYSVVQWGVLQVGLSLDYYRKQTRTTYYLMLMISRPILSLNEATQRIGEGDLTVRAEITTGDELEELAVSFNKMTERLQDTMVSWDYLDRIFEHMTESLVVTSFSGDIRMVNQATLHLLGYTQTELLGQSIDMLFDPEKERLTEKWAQSPAEKGLEKNIEKTFLTRSGEKIPVLFSAAVMKGGPTPKGIVCLALNIRERKIVEEHLQAAYQELKQTQTQLVQSGKLASIGELAAGVAHELNQPLMVIRANAQFICRNVQKGNLEMSEVLESLEPIERNTRRMMKITGQSLLVLGLGNLYR